MLSFKNNLDRKERRKIAKAEWKKNKKQMSWIEFWRNNVKKHF